MNFKNDYESLSQNTNENYLSHEPFWTDYLKENNTCYNFLIDYQNNIYDLKINKNHTDIWFKGKNVISINSNSLPNLSKIIYDIDKDILSVLEKCKNNVKEVIDIVDKKCVFKFIGGPIQAVFIK